MKILSWNVNGLRALERKGAWSDILKLNCDVICLQETKAEMLQLSPEVAKPSGYFAYFHSSSEKKGHAGTALYSKIEPNDVVYGLPDPLLDRQGRTITAYFDDFIVVNCYFPNGASATSSLDYKMKFYDAFLKYIEELKQHAHVIVVGDVNAAHTPIDLARPRENANRIGFLPQERAWIDTWIEHGWSDVFRYFYPTATEIYTYWDQKSGARERNVGWRIDYAFVNHEFLPLIKKIEILKDVLGSDHCPLMIEIKDK